MKKRADYAEAAQTMTQRIAELETKYGIYRAAAARYSVDSMPIVVDYTATVGRVEFFRRNDEHVFVQTKTLPDGQYGQRWESVRENPYTIRDEFYKVRTVGQAVEFLQKTGEFSPLRPRLSWTEFRKWQRFARLVQEHDELAAMARSDSWSGDCGEVLKALTGIYSSSFFDGRENDALYVFEQPKIDHVAELERLEEIDREKEEAENHEEWLKAFERETKELSAQHTRAEYEQEDRRRQRDLWRWFVRPPFRIIWGPIDEEAADRVTEFYVDSATGLVIPMLEDSALVRSGGLMEFLLPREQLVPRLIIQPKYTLEAIAAAIYTERIHGITSRKCDWCGELFKVDKHKEKRYCDDKPCKGNARKDRYRERLRNKKTKKSREAPKPAKLRKTR